MIWWLYICDFIKSYVLWWSYIISRFMYDYYYRVLVLTRLYITGPYFPSIVASDILLSRITMLGFLMLMKKTYMWSLRQTGKKSFRNIKI